MGRAPLHGLNGHGPPAVASSAWPKRPPAHRDAGAQQGRRLSGVHALGDVVRKRGGRAHARLEAAKVAGWQVRRGWGGFEP
jgi:hypothetical protein